jgi:malic enzyme
MREVALAVAVAVAGVAYEQDLATNRRPSDVTAAVQRNMYSPQYT